MTVPSSRSGPRHLGVKFESGKATSMCARVQMAAFVTAANIARWSGMLLLGLDQRQRQMIETLLLEERSEAQTRDL